MQGYFVECIVSYPKLLTNPNTFYNKKWTNQVVIVH